ncbi:hypothetical protein C7E20_10615 [Sphingobium sp. AEW4]|nr:TonB-dependent receptor [Sphingobium sp. JAI105]PSO11891.1 hypothetical protein C7E20_10615 [Sphingobium sp. AEW4]
MLASPCWAQQAAPAVTPAAAESDGAIEEIVVTAQKREESLQKVPISISALSANALETKGVRSVADFQRVPVPGLRAQGQGGSPLSMILDLRGITTSDTSQGTVEPGVAIYVDDVYVSRAQGAGQQLSDPERIEVLKGPQGTLFGRNAEGGAIRIVTKKPTGEFGGDGKVTVGNYGARTYVAHLNLPEIAGFSVKLDFLQDELNGFTRNGVTRLARLARQNAFGRRNITGYRGSVRWQPIDAVTIDYAYDHIDAQATNAYNGLVDPGAVPNPLYVRPSLLLQPAITREPSVNIFPKKSFTELYSDGFKTNTRAHTLNMAYELNDDITLKSITGYRKLIYGGSYQAGASLAFTPQTGIRTAADFKPVYADQPLGIDPTTRVYAIGGNNQTIDAVNSKTFSEELQLVGSTDTLQYVLGAYYYHEKVVDQRVGTSSSILFTSADYTQFLAVNPFLSAGVAGDGRTTISANTRTYAGFAQLTWSPDFADGRLHLTGGLRYTDDRKTFFRSKLNGLTGSTPTVLLGVTTVPTLQGQPFSTSRWDPAATIAYDISRTVNAYFRYAQAYKSGGIGVRSPGFVPFGVEVNKAYEAGLKSDLLNGHLRINVAAFENQIRNRQLTIQPDPQNNPQLTDVINTPGKTRVRGVEIETILAPTRDLTLSLSMSHTSYKLPPELLALNNLIANPAARSVYFVQNTPRWTGSAQLDYSFPRFSFGGQLVAHIDYSFASDVIGQGRIAASAYVFPVEQHEGNARLTLQDIDVGGAKFKIAGFVNNFANEIYPAYSSASDNFIPNSPRTYGIEIGAAF